MDTARGRDRFDPVAVAAVAAWFLSGPVLLAVGLVRGAPVFAAAAPGVRGFIVYGLASPLVGVLLALRHPRARFAAYVFLSVDIARSIVRVAARGAGPLPLVVDVAVLLYLQAPRMKRIYPRIDPAAVRARWRRRLRGRGTTDTNDRDA